MAAAADLMTATHSCTGMTATEAAACVTSATASSGSSHKNSPYL
jgi:hypothetical protein